MARYIDAEKIELSWYVPDVGYLEDYQKRHNDMATFAQRVIDSAKTEDVAPVVHAKWLHNSRANAPRCSACGRTMDNATPYCPFCGAIMDAKDTQETHKS